MFRELFGKFTGSKESADIEIVSRASHKYRQQQAEFYVRLLRRLDIDPVQPIAFHAQLRVVAFDFSESSLATLDEVLLSIRSEISGDFDEFVSTLPGLNLIVALGYYLGLTVSFLGKLPLEWVGYEKARGLNPGLAERLDTDLGALLGKTLSFPANVIAGLLFEPLPERTCATYAKSLIKGERVADAQLLGLAKAHALIAARQGGKTTEGAAVRALMDHALYLPSAVMMKRKPPYAENWRPVMIDRHGVACQVAFTSLHFADIFKRVEPAVLSGGVVPFSWVVGANPEGVGLAINIETDGEWVISPETIAHCRKSCAAGQT